MNLRDSLHREVADVRADHDELLRVARGRGRAAQRRRRVARDVGAVVALAALVAAVLAGASALPRASDTEGDEAGRPTQTGPALAPTPRPAPVPVTGRTAAAVLVEAVADLDRRGVLEATVREDGIGGSGDDGLAGEQALASLAVDTPTGEVELVVNVQRWSTLGLSPGCGPARAECRSRVLTDGDQETTFAPDDGKTERQLAAELVSVERDLRVVVSATEPAGGGLARDQLVALARASDWGLEVPARYADAAAALPSYDEVG